MFYGLQRQREDVKLVISYLERDIIFLCLNSPKAGWGLWSDAEARQCLGHSVVYRGPYALDGQLA